MQRSTNAIPLVIIATFGILVWLLVRAAPAPRVDTCMHGDVQARAQANVPDPLRAVYLDAARMRVGVGSIAIGDWRGLGDGLVAGGQAWARTTHADSPHYYGTVHNRYFQSSFFVYVPLDRHPAEVVPVEPGTRAELIWTQLARRYPQGVAFEGYVHASRLRTIAIAQPPIDGRSISANTPFYYTRPMESQDNVWVYVVGYASDSGSNGARDDAAHLLFPAPRHTRGLIHGLSLHAAPSNARAAPTADDVLSLGQVVGDTELTGGELRLYPIRRAGACSDAQVNE
jgi:hypothetical protein